MVRVKYLNVKTKYFPNRNQNRVIAEKWGCFDPFSFIKLYEETKTLVVFMFPGVCCHCCCCCLCFVRKHETEAVSKVSRSKTLCFLLSNSSSDS